MDRGFYLSKRKVVERITAEIHRTEKQQELYKIRKSLKKTINLFSIDKSLMVTPILSPIQKNKHL